MPSQIDRDVVGGDTDLHLVAVLQLVAAAAYYVLAGGYHNSPGTTASIVSLSGGALLANIVSVVLLVSETISYRRR